MITSLSIEDIFWGEIEEGRISFRFKGMPDSVHFTLSWTNPRNINLHITRNIGDGTNKPQIQIARWDKDFLDKFIPYIPALIIGKMYVPITFRNYPRSSRKNIRIIFFDEIENHANFKVMEKDGTDFFSRHSTVKRNRLRIKTTFEKDYVPFINSPQMRALFLNNLRSLAVNSFVSETSRCGIIFMGNKKFHFATYNNRCFILKKRKNFQEFLKLFMKPELVSGLIININEALVQIQDAKTYSDTIPHNKPYQLFLES